MGVFVLGILVGWLAEWMFYTFWVKPNEGDSDCSDIKAELELKNRQISSLQSQLADGSSAKASSALKAQTAVSTSSKKTVKKLSTAKTSKAAGSKSSASTKAKTTRTASTKNKTSKPAANKSASKARKPAAAAKPKTTASKPNKAAPRKSKAGGDDFTKLSGIGPSMSATLKSLGIDTFQKLAATDDDILRDMLEASGARMNNNKDVMHSWNEQATVAAAGDFAELKRMQSSLKR